MEICRWVSIIFLVVNTVYITAASFSFNDYLEEAYKDNIDWGHGVMCFFAVLFNVAALVITSLCFLWFIGTGDEADCGGNITLISMTYVFILLALVFGFARLRTDATVFTSGLMSFWFSFLLWSALASGPNPECNTLEGSGWTSFVQIFSWLIFTGICLVAMAVATKSEPGESTKGKNVASEMVAQPQDEKNEIEVQTSLADAKEGGVQKGDDINIFPVTLETIKFQLVLLFVSCHYSMVFTNWGNPIVNNVQTNYFASNNVSFWLKISIQWTSFFLFFLANICGRVCPRAAQYFD